MAERQAFEASRERCTWCRFGSYWHNCQYHEGYEDALDAAESRLALTNAVVEAARRHRDALLGWTDPGKGNTPVDLMAIERESGEAMDQFLAALDALDGERSE